MNAKNFLLALLLMASSLSFGNTVQTVTQVTSSVTIDDGIDYVVTSKTPFTASGEVNINGTSTLILKNVIPSDALKLMSHIKVNGATATNKTNCMVKIYGNGSIILAHGSTVKPFVAYTGEKYDGNSQSYAPGNRISLAGTPMNNAIQSFTLMRGYMVCLATKSDGRGYSRVFIADTQDKKMVLPAVLKGKVSSIRVMQWNDCGKRGYSGGDAIVLNALNASWFYDWNCGGSATNDWEYVPQHHHEGWPSITEIGNSNHSPHAIANNEPDNTNDSKEKVSTVDEVLATWPEMMATGKRLGSPAMSGNLNWLYAFIDSIDARGWRCDFICMHCYWYSDWPSWQSQLQAVHNRTKRPIWITEMNYGANWTGWPGSDRSGSNANFTIEKNHFAPVIDGLESTDWMERYAVYNWVEDCRSMYLNNKLTPMGQYYADKETNVGYNSSLEKVPSMPRQYSPSKLMIEYDKATHTATLTWHEVNGEYNKSMEIQVKKPGSAQWQTAAVPEQKEDEADYTATLESFEGYKYRVRVVDLKSVERFSNEAMVVNNNIEVGDEVSIDDKVLYIGGNMLVNGDFDLGMTNWENGKGEPLAPPYFQAVPVGGVDGGSYLQCYGSSTSKTDVTSLRKFMTLEQNGYYYVSVAACNGNSNQRVSTTNIEGLELISHLQMSTLDEWNVQATSFQVTEDTTFMIQFRNLQGKAQFDKISLARLWPTREEALADGEKCRKAYEEARTKYLETYVPRDTVPTDTMNYTLLTDKILSPDFNNATTGWNLSAGTYKAGDQRTATQAGKSCWNAWWSTSASGGENTTMEINQQVKGLEHGLYALECKATTEHYCETDQHAFIELKDKSDVKESVALPYGVLDIPTISDNVKWVTLATPYLYVSDEDTINIGFKGSKKDALENAFIPYGKPTSSPDRREGWWCATNFRLRYVPQFRCDVNASGWGAVCLPYTIEVSNSIKLYQIAGITSDSTRICLEEATTFDAGTPYIYYCTDSIAIFNETGKKVSTAKTNYKGLRGSFSSVSKYPVGALVLTDGKWKYIPDTESRYSIPRNTAYIQKISNLTVLDNWTGISLPTSGLVNTLLGDANGDGNIDVSDITTIASFILGNNPQPFVFANADADEDGTITVSDITATATIILTK